MNYFEILYLFLNIVDTVMGEIVILQAIHTHYRRVSKYRIAKRRKILNSASELKSQSVNISPFRGSL